MKVSFPGHNFEAHDETVPEIVSPKMAEDYLDGDIGDAITGCACHIGPFIDLDPVRQAVLINMCFNLGIKGLLKFKHMLEAIGAQDWQMASLAMMNSLWATQVKGRADELARMMATGEWPASANG
jgi:lysozyme